jgi:RNA polymerase sigma-70 factor, ECF subfamily
MMSSTPRSDQRSRSSLADVAAKPNGEGASAEVAFVSKRALVGGLRAGRPEAIRVFYDRYAVRVQRMLYRILGNDQELVDIHHEVFLRALTSIGRLKDADALDAWLLSVAVNTARGAIQQKVQRRWLSFGLRDNQSESMANEHSADLTEAGEALRAVRALLATLDIDERIAFVLRFVEGMELREGAAAAGVSLATFKRRLARAEAHFTRQAAEDPVLGQWLAGGTRWGKEKSL